MKLKFSKSAALLSMSALTAISLALPAQAAIVTYATSMSGAAEAPPNASPGMGMGTVILDDIAMTMRVMALFTGLTGTTTAAHIHCCTTLPLTGTAGVATVTPSFTGFPLGVTSGVMDHTFDMTAALGSWNAAYVTANGGSQATAFAALKSGLDSGKAYFNVHTSTFGGGEIRGFLQMVPEPGTWSLVLLAGAAAAGLSRRRQGH